MVTKSIFVSTTFWGSVVSLFAMLAPKVFTNIVGTNSQATVVTTIVGIIGFLVTVYGRFKATTPVSLTGGTK
jgi:hypothetical protein